MSARDLIGGTEAGTEMLPLETQGCLRRGRCGEDERTQRTQRTEQTERTQRTERTTAGHDERDEHALLR